MNRPPCTIPNDPGDLWIGQLSINDNAHGLSGNQNRMIGFCGGVLETGGNILGFEIGVILKDLGLRIPPSTGRLPVPLWPAGG